MINNEVIKLNSISCDAYSIIDAFICADAAQGRLDTYKDTAASMLYDLAVGIWASEPTMLPAEVLSKFNDSLGVAISKHVSLGNLTVDYVKEHKNMTKAFNKIRNALQRGLDIRKLGSTNACEKAVTKANKEAAIDADNEAVEAQVKDYAKKKGITDTEAREKLKKAGIVDVVTRPADESGEVSNNQSTVLQDTVSNPLADKCSNLSDEQLTSLISMIEALNYVVGAKPEQGATMLASWVGKADSAKTHIMRSVVKAKVA